MLVIKEVVSAADSIQAHFGLAENIFHFPCYPLFLFSRMAIIKQSSSSIIIQSSQVAFLKAPLGTHSQMWGSNRQTKRWTNRFMVTLKGKDWNVTKERNGWKYGKIVSSDKLARKLGKTLISKPCYKMKIGVGVPREGLSVISYHS